MNRLRRTRPEKLLVLIPVPHAVSGVTRVALTLSAQFRKQGLPLQVVFPATSGRDPVVEKWAAALDVRTDACDALLPDDARRTWHDVWALKKFVKSTGATVVNIHYGGSRPSLKDLIAIRLAGARCVVACHNHSFRMPLRHALPTRAASMLSAAIVPCSAEIHDILVEAGVSRKKLVTIHGGVPRPPDQVPSRAAARNALALPESAFVVGTITRLSPEKAVDRLLYAAAPLANPVHEVHVVVKGDDGSERESLVALGEQLLGARFHYFDMSADNESIYAALDVFALTSNREGYPLVLMEAAFRSLPCVSTNVGSIDELIVDGETGFLVDDGDVAGLTHSLERFLLSSALCSSMGQKANAHAEREFTDEVMARKFSRVLALRNPPL